MADIGDERKHKPSAKHTLEEVRKSLEDLVRNEFVDAGPAPTQDLKTSGQADKPAPFASAPPQRSRQRLQTMQKQKLDTSQVLKSLNELIGNDLSEADRRDNNGVQPTTDAGANTDIDTSASEPGDAELADQSMSAHTESLESLAAALAEVDEVEVETSDAADAVELADENAAAEEIPWVESSDVSADKDYPIIDEGPDDLDATIDLTADIEMADAGPEEITLEAAPPDVSPVEEAPTDEALSSTPTPKDRGVDANTPEVPETEGIELSLDETEATTDESLEVDFADAVTSTSSESLPSPELSLADDDSEPGVAEEPAMATGSSPPAVVETSRSLEGDQPRKSVEYHQDEEGPFVSEAQQTFEFEALEPPSTPDEALEATESEVIDEIEAKALHETTEISDETPRQAENSELRLEDTTSVLVEPAGEMIPLVPDEEMSMELGAELEAATEATSSADDVGVEDDSPALSPMDALEIPGEEAMSEEVTEEDQAAMQNSGYEHSTTVSREASDTTTVLLTPDQAQPADQESGNDPDVELEPGEPVSESRESATPAPVKASSDVSKPSETKQQESTPIVSLPSDKQESVTSKAPKTRPKSKVFTVASAGKANELKMPGIDFDLGTGHDNGTRDAGTEPNRLGAAGDSSPDDSEYIDLAEPTPTEDIAPAVKSSKDGYKRTPWPTPSALFRKDSAPKPKRMPWGNRSVGARGKGSPHVTKSPLSATISDAPTKTLESGQPKPKAKLEQGKENIPVLNEVVDRAAQPKKPKKKPVPLATPKVTSPDTSRKKQSKHKAREPSSATAKTEARNVAVNVIAKLNMELRKCGERALSPVTIDRLQFLLREALEQHAKDVENGGKRR